MLREKIFVFEYAFIAFFLVQTFLPIHFSCLTSFTTFLVLAVGKFHFEGIRLVFLLIVLAEVIFLLTTSFAVRLPVTILTLVALRKFPSYKYPNPTGKYRVGYKDLDVPGGSRAGVYYPTTERTKDVKFSPPGNPISRTAEGIIMFTLREKKKPLPRWLFTATLHFLSRQKMGVNRDASVAEPDDKVNGWPVVILSHGLSANIHMYNFLIKEWVSHGFVVLSVDHEEKILGVFNSDEEFVRFRNEQLNTRKKVIKSVLDYISESKNVQNLFGSSTMKLNYNKIFLAGHSFGGAAAGETAVEDKRVTGGLVICDPWYGCANESILYKPLNKPIFELRSVGVDKRPLAKNQIMRHVEVNSQNKEWIISGKFKGSVHFSCTDLMLQAPREMVMYMGLQSIDEVEHQVITQTLITRLFLETVVKYNEELKVKGQEIDVREETMARYRENVKKLGQSDTWLLDAVRYKAETQ